MPQNHGMTVIQAQRHATDLRADLQRVIDRHAFTLDANRADLCYADGMVTGIASVNQNLFGPERSRAVVMAYDATVLAGMWPPLPALRGSMARCRCWALWLGAALPATRRCWAVVM